MSDETAKRLEEAQAIEREQRAALDAQKVECLTVIARAIPARVDETAKRAALSQPEVAKSLGSEGIRTLRGELSDAAAALATEVEGAVEQIKWPPRLGSFSEGREVQSAITKWLDQRMGALESIFERHGFEVHAHGGVVHTYRLFKGGDCAGVVAALKSYPEAERALADAKAAHDADVVESLWND